MEDIGLKNMIAYQENLERILDSLTEGIIAHDLNRRILFFNRSAERTTGYKREDVLGRDCHGVFDGPFCGGKCSFTQIPYDSIGVIVSTRND
jgi:PAS domain-containing protein